ncbi:UPF0481 protein At3g47200-like [Corylus avellana]|uniref:UPF0481 protein At3g47200-like n=1 Tax=Corylus avellana TaxID=13451 RepID=UPI001E1F90F9|nr:UPF0481 protein At3g47200-like [Corylus avellana]XP_059462728.1 UPF0481 protein At3g47200-like [Corylus avellana]
METGEGEASHVVEVDIDERDIDKRLLAKMKSEISKSNPSNSPRKTDTGGKRCIYKSSDGFKHIDRKWLEPQVVAIGPYHRDKPQVQMMEVIKKQCLGYFIKNKEVDYLLNCLKTIRSLEIEKDLRECYSETEKLGNSDDFVQMMVYDGCFILDLLLFLNHKKEMHFNFDKEEAKSDHPLYQPESQERVNVSKFYTDLLLLENQIPFIVLEKLYELCKPGDVSLFAIVRKVLGRSLYPIIHRNRPPTEWLHLLDLVRSLFIPPGHNEKPWMRFFFSEKQYWRQFKLFSPIPSPCVTKLRRVGIKIKGDMADSFLEVKFKRGVIEMPVIALDHEMCSFLVNCVAFEQCHRCSTHFSIYATFLDGLVNTDKDIEYLCDRRIIANSFGTDNDAAVFINNLGKDLTIYRDYKIDNDYLLDFFEDVNDYFDRKRLHWAKWQWTSFKREYFGKPWLLISAFVAFVLLVLTYLQTHFTIYAYQHPKN